MIPPGKCSRAKCVPELGCNFGEETPRSCKYWTPSRKDDTDGTPTASASTVAWSGRGLGTADLELLAARGPLTVIGILGAHDSGKTTLLARLWLMMARGEQLAGGMFAGTWTSGAWESLAEPMRWTSEVPPGFPMHTTSEQTRIPSLLHLALRMPNEALRDVVFTDAPGEWFSRWSYRADDPGAEGATWIARRADALLVLADCERLAGLEHGRTRGETRALLDRLGAVVGRRPTALVWSMGLPRKSGHFAYAACVSACVA